MAQQGSPLGEGWSPSSKPSQTRFSFTSAMNDVQTIRVSAANSFTSGVEVDDSPIASPTSPSAFLIMARVGTTSGTPVPLTHNPKLFMSNVPVRVGGDSSSPVSSDESRGKNDMVVLIVLSICAMLIVMFFIGRPVAWWCTKKRRESREENVQEKSNRKPVKQFSSRVPLTDNVHTRSCQVDAINTTVTSSAHPATNLLTSTEPPHVAVILTRKLASLAPSVGLYHSTEFDTSNVNRQLISPLIFDASTNSTINHGQGHPLNKTFASTSNMLTQGSSDSRSLSTFSAASRERIELNSDIRESVYRVSPFSPSQESSNLNPAAIAPHNLSPETISQYSTPATMSSSAFTVCTLTKPFLDPTLAASISISCPPRRRPRAASTPARLDNGVAMSQHTPTSDRSSTGAWNEVMAEFPALPQARTSNLRASDLRVMSSSAEGSSHVTVPVRPDMGLVPIPRPLPSISRNAVCSPLLRSAQRPLSPIIPLPPLVDAQGYGDPPLYSGLSTHQAFFSTAAHHTLSDPFQASFMGGNSTVRGHQYHNSQYSTGSSFSLATPPPQYSSRASSLHLEAVGIGDDGASHMVQGNMESAQEVFMRSHEGFLRSRDEYLAAIERHTLAPNYTSLNESGTPEADGAQDTGIQMYTGVGEIQRVSP